MNFTELLKHGYENEDWASIKAALDMFGIQASPPKKAKAGPAKAIKEGKKSKGNQNEPPIDDVRPEPPKSSRQTDMNEFKVDNQLSQTWEEIPKKRVNLFVDSKEDLKNAKPYQPKGSRKTYANHDAYLNEVLYPKKRTSTPRAQVSKVKIDCSVCKKTYEEYPSTIVYSNLEEKRWTCNNCSGQK